MNNSAQARGAGAVQINGAGTVQASGGDGDAANLNIAKNISTSNFTQNKTMNNNVREYEQIKGKSFLYKTH